MFQKFHKNLKSLFPSIVVWCLYINVPIATILLIISYFYEPIRAFTFQIGLLNPTEGWGPAFLMVMVFAGITISAAWFTGKGSLVDVLKTEKFLKEFSYYYPIWGTIQQFMFFTFYAFLIMYIQGDFWPRLILIAAFMLFHFPNWFLMYSTGLLISIFAMHMEIYHNIFAIGVAHGLIATLFEHFSPKYVTTKYVLWKDYIKVQRRISKLKDRKNGEL